ncbi:hypothetical protein K435DRAFT_792014 [Dendrothele bispora CBS 962.96]|uniref:Uncharacterized protein n=1 Tax=Dendrothele bispora (strain CBS 962.96) TaxID=1314807 RepID=A0A4S8MLM7_DENBC|nr:hypothetical protein K435DRAFT_792014 [Dendrothele bispora CBS 962.96]
MSCSLCPSESQNEGLAPAGAYGTQTTCSCGDSSLTETLSVPLELEDLDILKVELHNVQESIHQLESKGSHDTVPEVTELQSDAALVQILGELLGHVDMTKEHADPSDSLSITERESQGEFVNLPPKNDVTWHMKRFDAAAALEDELCHAQHAEMLEERELIRLQLLVERAHVKVMQQRVLTRQKKEKREKLARAACELRRHIKNTRFQL